MRLNRLLSEVTGLSDDFGEWPYFLSIFGEPSPEGPWAWQIDGHHLCVNGTIIGDQLVLTPTFMGSEPCHVFDGPLAGTMVFCAEERASLELIRSLDDQQAARAVLRSSIHPDDLPPELQHPFDGRMEAGAFQDNAVVPFAGVCAAKATTPSSKHKAPSPTPNAPAPNEPKPSSKPNAPNAASSPPTSPATATSPRHPHEAGPDQSRTSLNTGLPGGAQSKEKVGPNGIDTARKGLDLRKLVAGAGLEPATSGL